ncbi:hypothetical protein CALVIDRAFT_567970 [Calocera viscosa TUFC12733]|uniref:Ser-Thr-rich glycosyl-phosphatidyl-inositol-anchored membrane family-domain-containing protein n=1 Tax=Calocera viscosa (strain TUFC12733) TaxID=1330018 RepID=A0A167HNB4_CALVF|nr:hypothetical protein CALVIDRAFT_567970 [Calocera viscosa TUFC12733]
MRPSTSLALAPLLAFLPAVLAQNIPTYFIITTPSKGSIWSNNATNLVQWTAAVDQVPYGIFDIELARLSTDGLLFVAENVPISLGGLNINLDNVPDGDDYFMMFLDAQHGISWSTSQRFAIAGSNGTVPTTDGTVPTATISGSPNPTAGFSTVFAAVATSHARRMLAATFAGLSPGWAGVAVAGMSVLVGAGLAL